MGSLNSIKRKFCCARLSQGWSIIFLCVMALTVSGCASGKLRQARNDFYSGRIDQASEALSNPEDVSGRDRLLYYMEKGLILNHLWKYKESIDVLLNASKLMEEQDIINVGEQAESMVTNEWITQYKGEYAERLLVHTYLMMDYLLSGRYDDALVEGKQALQVYDRYPKACREDYFTRALVALSYEVLDETNDAYIEYKKLAEIMPDPSPVAAKLYFLGKQLGFDDEVEKYRQYISDAEMKIVSNPDSAEIILFVSQGRSPVKIPRNIVLPPSIRFSFCTYSDRGPSYYPPRVGISSDAGDVAMVTTNVGAVLRDSLQERLTQIIAKETARAAAKEAISRQTRDPLVEVAVRLAFFLMEEPDTRSWETLPGYLTMVRIPVLPGRHHLSINASGGIYGRVSIPDIKVIPGRRYYFYSVNEN